ncbi:TnsA-like heteromeric transposase endonuclease subunit [Dactylosporangium sp. CA-139114]|uniref:TnsA-like heteromeric transposase endonuclease subunit n=1 Tax=Dactylosporangium sp. CA-139114 TaxID=3239931 RepID=UPI003D982231
MQAQVASHGRSTGFDRGFELSVFDAGGAARRVDLAHASGLVIEQLAPVRAMPTYRGQRSNQGLWWLATTARHVGYESWLERDHLTLLDFDPAVVGVAAQPFWLMWQHDGRPQSHAPDFFARLADGGGVVVDVRPAGRVRPRDALAFEATRQACDLTGWQYRLVHEPDPVRMANVRWLAGFRHPRCRRTDLAAAVTEVFREPLGLLAGAGRVGDPLVCLPNVYHLLWTGVLATDLAVPLSERSPVQAASG